MAETEDPAVAAARLEEALERIAALADQVAARTHEPPGEEPVDAAVVAERLDALIATLRAALAGRPA